MASSLSDDEFQRMQLQLLELRTENYQLDDRCKRQDRELQMLRQHTETVDKDLQKANRALQKSKKAREFEMLIQENDGLQRKLHSQEEEFRLQNTTLMQELSSLVSSNEALETEVRELKSGGGGGGSASTNQASQELQEEVRHLQAQNAALQKKIDTYKEEYESKQSTLQETIKTLQAVKTSPRPSAQPGDNKAQRDENTEEGEPAECDVTDNTEEYNKDVLLDLVTQTENQNQRLQDQLKEFSDLQVQFDTEKEEKKILKEQMQNNEKNYKEQIFGLQADVAKFTEKLKKKQESYVQLQTEKEQFYSESGKKLEDLQASKEQEVKMLTDQASRLQEELVSLNRQIEEQRQKLNQRIKDQEEQISNLQAQVSEVNADTHQQLQDQNQRFHEQLQDVQNRLKVALADKGDLHVQVQESQKVANESLQQLSEAQQERDNQIQALQEANRVAEKRKSLLDELAIKYQKELDSHREQVKSMEEARSKEVEDLTMKLDDAEEGCRELERCRQQVEELKGQVQSLEESKGWLERTLKETEESLQQTKESYDSEIASSHNTHLENINTLKDEHSSEIQEMQLKIDSEQTEKGELEEKIEKLKQEIKDGLTDKKIHEKKGASMLKDLKRQLHSERKRVEKLQERLQEVLSDSRNRESVEELFSPIDCVDGSYRGDASSVSSWTASLSGLGTNKDLSSPSPRHSTPPSVLEQENNDLLARLAEVQQEKWNLDERVSHLESSTAAMAEDLLRKQALIEHYAMEGKADHVAASPVQEKVTLKKVIDFVKDKGDSDLKEMNRKLQRMLEETLTKNMHLQQDLEVLSQEVVRLSKAAASPVHEAKAATETKT